MYYSPFQNLSYSNLKTKKNQESDHVLDHIYINTYKLTLVANCLSRTEPSGKTTNGLFLFFGEHGPINIFFSLCSRFNFSSTESKQLEPSSFPPCIILNFDETAVNSNNLFPTVFF